MSAGFKWWDLLGNEYLSHNPTVGAAAVGATVLVAAGVTYAVTAPRLNAATTNDEAFIPPSSLRVRNFFELIGEFVSGLARDVIGDHYTKYLPLLIFIFMWTLLNNLLGVLPAFGSATDNLNMTFAMGGFVFLYYNFMGFKEGGLHYLEQFTGHLKGLWFIPMMLAMFVIELISHMVRPVTLAIRLRTNIFADHTVYDIFAGIFLNIKHSLGGSLGVFGEAIGWVLGALAPVPIMLLGILVCLIQAFVFTLLTTIYIGIATAHEEH
jgi:F-type H+-transporting ATPase subunit a